MKSKNSVARKRSALAVQQNGQCHYCRVLMCMSEPAQYARKYGLTLKEALGLRCTLEHLKARSEGGSNSKSNLVAACKVCNCNRHKARTPLPPQDYGIRVRRRVSLGKWHAPAVLRSGLIGWTAPA